MLSIEERRKYIREWMKKDRAENPDKYRLRNRLWMEKDRLKNPIKYLERSRTWSSLHPSVYPGKEVARKWYHTSYAKQAARQNLLQRLKNRPCMDCGDWFPTCAMQFDHRDPSTKLCDISRLRHSSVKKILEEVAKCDIVCANCHFIRTDKRKAQRYGWLKGR